MTEIPLPVTSSPGSTPHASAGRLLNCYFKPLAKGARALGKIVRSPGLRAWATSGQTGPRGSILVGSTLYSAFSGNVTRFDSDGAATSVGSLTGTDKVFWARNNKAPTPDLVVVDPGNGASIVDASTVDDYPDVNVGSPNSVCFLDGYFFFTYGDGTCIATDLNDTAINALTFIKCEGKPDSLFRAVPFKDLYLFGADSIEVWHNTAEPAPGFPFSRLVVIPCGAIGRYAISGFEDNFGKGIVFVRSDRTVCALDGFSPKKISTPDVDTAIATFIEAGGDPSTIEMFPYVLDGQSCIVMRCAAWTWVLDLETILWHERESHLSPTARFTGSIKAFDKWLTGDAVTGDIVELTQFSNAEIDDPLVVMVESGPVSKFPNKAEVAQATFDVAQGVGITTGSNPTQTDPVVSIQYSDDGLTWSTPRIRKLGKQSVKPRPIKVVKCGTAGIAGRRWRLTCSDAVPFELFGGDQSDRILPA